MQNYVISVHHVKFALSAARQINFTIPAVLLPLMSVFMIRCVGLSLLIWLCCQIPTYALKATYSKTSSATFSALVVDDFGMAVGGKISLDYNVYAEDSTKPYESYMVLLILTHDQLNGWYDQLGSSSADLTTMCQQPSMLREKAYGTGSISFDIVPSVGENRYSVGVIQCWTGYADNPVHIDLTAVLLNPRPESSEYSHLSIERVMETRVVEGLIIIYALLIAGMCGQIYISPRATRLLHVLFLASLVAAFVVNIVRYGGYYRFNKYGTASTSIEIAQNIFSTVSTTFFLSSLLLLSLGWTLIRAALSEKEVQLINIFIGAYFVFGIASSVCVENTSTCQALELVPFILQSLILLGTIIAMNFSVTQLRAMVSNSPWVPSTPLQYARLKQYHVFRLVFLLYLLLPTAFLIYEVVVFSWKQSWVGFALSELLEVALVFHVGVTFSPLNESLMVRAFDGSQNAGANNGVPGAGAGDGGAEATQQPTTVDILPHMN